MEMNELDILWEGDIQVCALDKKKVWRPRTKDMQGSLAQYSDSKLKLDMSVDLVKLTDKRTLPGSEEIDLSNVTFISDMIHPKECKEFFFFCQCIKLNAEGEEEIVVHTFKTELDDVRRRFMEAILEYMQRHAIKQSSSYFNVIIEKEVKTADFKLYGEYSLRTTETGIEFLISENIPGIAFDQADINSAKILEDNRPDVGEHVIDLIMRGPGLNNNYHIIMKSKGGLLLLIYLQRGLDNCMQEIIGNKGSINSLPISELSVHTSAIPPKPDNEAKPPLPPRSACSHSEASAFEFRNLGKVRFDPANCRDIPPLPPRQELAASPNLPPRENNALKSMTLPHGLRSNFSQNELKLGRIEHRRASDDLPPSLPERNFFSSTLPRNPQARSPMPLPDEAPILSETRMPILGIESGSISYDGVSPSSESDPEEPQYAEIKFGEQQLNASEVPTKPVEECPYVTPNPVNEEELIDIFKENQKNRKRGYYKKPLCPTSIKITADDSKTGLECETPVTEIPEDPGYVDVLSPTETLDESGYLQMFKPDLDQLDSLGYVTVREGAISPPSPAKRKLSGNTGTVTPVNSPVVPPRAYREFIKD